MPVTAKLSRKFYDTFGDEIANDLVEWFNAVDATYRSELKELNDLNFARFDAKLDQRIAELSSDIRAGLAGLETRLTTRLMTWLFVCWATTLGTLVALLKL